MGKFSKKKKIGIAAAVLMYALVAVMVTPQLRHAWWYLQENANRRFSTFCALTAATCFFPWCAASACDTWNSITTRYEPSPVDPSVFAAAFGTNLAYEAVDARGMTFGEFKTRLEKFKAAHGGYHLWCFGRHDYCLTPNRDADFGTVLSRFSDERVFALFAASRIYSPAGLFSCYVGTHDEIGPAFADIPSYGALRGKFASVRSFFLPFPAGGGAPLNVLAFTPFDVSFPGWLKRGRTDATVFLAFEDGYETVQEARREALLGFKYAANGFATNAIACWVKAAKANPLDPLLIELAAAIDAEARAHLAIGNVNGALKCYENRVEVFPGDVAAIHNFGVCMKKAGQPALAARVFAKAVELDPLQDAHRMELIDCAEAGGHPDLAVRQIDVLLKRHPEDIELKKRRARILVKKHFDMRKKREEEKAKTSPARYLPSRGGKGGDAK